MRKFLTLFAALLVVSAAAFADRPLRGATLAVAAPEETTTETEGATSVAYSVTQTSGTLYHNGVTTGQSWSNMWVYNVSANNPAPLMLSASANNIGYTNGNLALFEGGSGSCTYALTVPAGYIITGYSFDYVNFGSANVTITIDGETTLTSSSTQQTHTATGLEKNSVIMVLAGSNKGVTFKNFTVQIAATTATEVQITDLAAFTNGWYRIKPNTVADLAEGFDCIINASAEYRQTASNFYGLMFGTVNEEKPAESLVYVTRNSNTFYVSLINGHKLNSNCTSARNTESPATTISIPDNDGLFRFGGYWAAYAPGNGNTYVGQSSSKTGNRYEVYSVNVTGYDIYTVTFSGVENASEIGSDPQVECTHASNLGIAKVYNGGKFFFPTGTTLTTDNFVSAVEGKLCVSTIDSDAKTIAVQFFEGYSAELYEAIAAAQATLDGTVEGTSPGCYSTEDRAKLTAAIEAATDANKIAADDYSEAISTLNSAVTTYIAAVQGVKYSTDENNTTWYYIISDSEHSYCNGLAMKSRGVGTPLTYATKMVDPSMVWCFEQNEEGNVAIRNYAGNYIASNQSNGASTAGMTETAAYTYTVAKWSGASPDGLAYTLKSDGQNPLHAQQYNTMIVTWEANDNNASLWRLVEVTAEELASTATMTESTVQQGIAVTGIGNTDVPLLRVQLSIEGLNGVANFSALSGTVGTAPVTRVALYSVSDEFEFRAGKEGNTLMGEAAPAEDGSFTITFTEAAQLPCGQSPYYWLVADVSTTATEGAEINAAITSYTVNDATVTETAGDPEYSTTVFLTSSTVEYGNTHGSRHYRIPAITTAMNGWLVAVTDKRFSSAADLPNNIDVVARVSKDNGATWSEPVTIAGTAELGGDYGHGDPAICTDRVTGDIIVLVTSKKGFYYGTPDDPARLKCIISHDNGVTWDAPVDITDQIYGAGCSDPVRCGWYSMFFSSGAFIQTSKGTLMCVAPVRTTNTGTHSLFEAHIIRSDDHGKTWTCNGVPALTDADESKIVELNDGTLLVKSRNQNRGYVYYATSTDDGASWSERAQFTDVYDPACNGDIIRMTSQHVEGDANRLLLSIPDATSRKNVTVYLSTDEAGTWPIKKSICTKGSAYSTMTMLEDGTVGIYYEEDALEGGYSMRFCRFSLNWLTKDTDSPASVDEEKFTAARLKEAQTLAANLPQYAASISGTEGNMTVGANYIERAYNVTDAETAALTAAATATDLQTVQDALTNYMDGYSYTSKLMLPVDGKVYRIKNVITNTDEAYKYHYIANGTDGITFPTEADNSTTLWVCQQITDDDDKRTFVSAAGDYSFAWRGRSETALNYKIGAGVAENALSMWNSNIGDGSGRYLAVTNESWGTNNGTPDFNQSSSTSQATNWSTDFVFEEVSSDDWAGFTASVYDGTNGDYGTLHLPFAVTLPAGVTANSVTLNDAGTELVETAIVSGGGVLPALTPVLLTGTAGSHTFAPAASLNTEQKETGLSGTLAAKAVTDANAYILAYSDEENNSGEILFYLLDSSDNTVNANKAYYVGSTESASSYLRLGGGTTGIGSVDASGLSDGAIYDLTGRRLREIPAPGIYIVNGKKVFIK